jgi:glycosyltransferase involved in cell wall biosynthesis
VTPSRPPRVSIVLPCRDADKVLPTAIDSILIQTCQDWELLLVDDGSADATADVADKYAASDSRIRAIHRPAEGLVAALRHGCDCARGELIARMDADDVCDRRRLELQMHLMDDDPRIGLCGTGVREIGDEPGLGRHDYIAWMNGLCLPDEIARQVYVECPIAHPTFMMRREALESVGGYQDRGWAEDYDLLLRMHVAGWRLAKVPEALFSWRENRMRMSRTDPRYGVEKFRACKREYLRRGVLAGNRPFYQWGAGNAGKDWLREWDDLRPLAVVDINPRKIGKTIHGTRVIRPEDLPPPGSAVVLVAVVLAHARAEIRQWITQLGYVEGRDWFFIC